MSQTYCRPIEGVEILSIAHYPSRAHRITVKTEDGISIVGPAIMVHLRGTAVLHEWCGPLHRKLTRDIVAGLGDDELLIGEAGTVLMVKGIRRKR